MGHKTSAVAQCSGLKGHSCDKWYTVHASGLCKDCRIIAAAKAQKAATRKPRKRQPVPGSLEWAEARGGLIGGYETDDTYCPD